MRKWPDNTSYDGQYQHGLRHGCAAARFARSATACVFLNSLTEVGRIWVSNRIGLYSWPDGTQYEGQWYEHTRDGFGIHTYADGMRYEVNQKL